MATLSSIITFTPTIGGNDSKPESEKFSVKLKAVNVQKKQEQLRKFIQMDPKQLMSDMMDPRQQGEIKELLTKNFVRFVNFEVTDEATEADVLEGKKGFVAGEEKVLAVGEEYSRPGRIQDLFDLGEFELIMEIFMFMIGSSQLRKPVPPANPAAVTAGHDREDEEKNSESPSGISLVSTH